MESSGSFSKVPKCVVCTLIAFTVVVMTMGASMIFVFFRVSKHYVQIQELIEQLPEGDVVELKLQEHQASFEKVEAKKLDAEKKFKDAETAVERKSEGLAQTAGKNNTEINHKIDTASHNWSVYHTNASNHLAGAKHKCGGVKSYNKTHADLETKLAKIRIEITTNITQRAQTIALRRNEINELSDKDIIPEGFIYFQIKDEKSPSELWSTSLWIDKSSNFDGHHLFASKDNGGAAERASLSPEDLFKALRVGWDSAENLKKGATHSYINDRAEGTHKLVVKWEEGSDYNILKPKLNTINIKIHEKKGAANAWEKIKTG